MFNWNNFFIWLVAGLVCGLFLMWLTSPVGAGYRYEYQCQEEDDAVVVTTPPTPTPTQEPARQADPYKCEDDHSCPGTVSTPQCTATKPDKVVPNFHIYRLPNEAQVVWYREQNNDSWNVVVYYGRPGKGDEHSVVLNNWDSGYWIKELNGQDFNFRAEFLNDCANGASTKTVVDSAKPKLYR